MGVRLSEAVFEGILRQLRRLPYACSRPGANRATLYHPRGEGFYLELKWDPESRALDLQQQLLPLEAAPSACLLEAMARVNLQLDLCWVALDEERAFVVLRCVLLEQEGVSFGGAVRLALARLSALSEPVRRLLARAAAGEELGDEDYAEL
jgi:hypothetical protein